MECSAVELLGFLVDLVFDSDLNVPQGASTIDGIHCVMEYILGVEVYSLMNLESRIL